jgi:2-dehydro-3-deoxyphosphogluconate aldolase / (4S)-4-hydroxy-2-oxoglutarate aldolase
MGSTGVSEVPSELVERLRASRLLPVLRCDSAEEAVEQAAALHEVGASVIELTATTPGWADALRALRRRLPQAFLGVGTIVTSADAAAAIAAAADFLVSPYPAPEARVTALAAGTPMIEGGFTPGEIAALTEHGPAKLFPAAAVGADFLRAVLRVLPGALVIPTGGIALADVTRWLDAGALAVGVGSGLFATGAASPALAELVAWAKPA